MNSQTSLIPYGKTIYSLRRFILTAKNQSISHSYTKTGTVEFFSNPFR